MGIISCIELGQDFMKKLMLLAVASRTVFFYTLADDHNIRRDKPRSVS